MLNYSSGLDASSPFSASSYIQNTTRKILLNWWSKDESLKLTADRERAAPWATPARPPSPRSWPVGLSRAKFLTQQHSFGCIFLSSQCAVVFQLWTRFWMLFWSFWAALGAQRIEKLPSLLSWEFLQHRVSQNQPALPDFISGNK